MKKAVSVSVGVIKRNDEVFLGWRNATQHQGELWEFPGGKVDAGETPLMSLKRELKEEIGITIDDLTSVQPMLLIEHQYSDKSVRLHVFLVEEFRGDAHGAEGQKTAWVPINQLECLDFPEANQRIIDLLIKEKD